MRISDWSSDVCSADLDHAVGALERLDPLDVIEVAEVLQVVADAIDKEVRCRTVAAKDRRIAVAFALGDADARDIAHDIADALHRLVTNQLFRHHRDRLRHVAQRRVGLGCRAGALRVVATRSEEHTSELQSLMRISYAVFCLKQKNNTYNQSPNHLY